jgi:hypothetical protein
VQGLTWLATWRPRLHVSGEDGEGIVNPALAPRGTSTHAQKRERDRTPAQMLTRREAIEAALDEVCAELGDDDLDVVRAVAVDLHHARDRWVRQLAELYVDRTRRGGGAP